MTNIHSSQLNLSLPCTISCYFTRRKGKYQKKKKISSRKLLLYLRFHFHIIQINSNYRSASDEEEKKIGCSNFFGVWFLLFKWKKFLFCYSVSFYWISEEKNQAHFLCHLRSFIIATGRNSSVSEIFRKVELKFKFSCDIIFRIIAPICLVISHRRPSLWDDYRNGARGFISSQYSKGR